MAEKIFKKRALTVLHQKDSSPGLVGRILLENGYQIEKFIPCIGQKLPENIDLYDAVIIFGGPQSANDDADKGIRRELDWIEKIILPGKIPTLGICLGAQQLARVLGAYVSSRNDGLVEIGYREVSPTEFGQQFLPKSEFFYQWHAETFTIPDNAVHLASSNDFSNQAFSYSKHIYGIEFHPEITLAMINNWCASATGMPKLQLPGADNHASQLFCHEKYSEDVHKWLETFLDNIFFKNQKY